MNSELRNGRRPSVPRADRKVRAPLAAAATRAVCAVSSLTLWVQLSAAEPLDVGNRRQLLFDERFVQQATNVEIVVHPPRKTGEQTIVSEPGWPLGGYHCALYDAGVYHLWYSAGGCVLYARSKDGIHFEKPALHLKLDRVTNSVALAPNAVMGRGLGDVQGGMHGLYVFLDPNAPAEERFKLVANPEEFKSMLQVFASPDGIHWKLRHRDVITFRSEKPHHLDSQNVVFWDDRLGQYVAYFRRNLREKNSQGRTVARAESPDFAHFPQVEDSPVVMQVHERHPGHFDPVRKAQTAVVDVYCSGAIQYPWAADAYFMFPWEYYHYGGHLAEFRKELPTNAGVVDTRFAVSRDGVKWSLLDHQPFVRLGMKGEFDSKRIYLVHGILPAPNERELYLYYLGTSDTHGWNRDDRNNRLLTAASVAPTGPNALSRLVLRRDGFVSVRAPYDGGEFTTPILRFAGDKLLLNVDTSAVGEVRVEIQDESGKPIPGFSSTDADLVHTANEINRVVTWRGGESALEKLGGQPVRLRFVMRDADLYALQFVPRGGI